MGAWGDGNNSTQNIEEQPDQYSGLFQSDHDFDMISELDEEADLHMLMEDDIAKAKANGDMDAEENFYYSMYCPSHPEVVRKYLDSGVLASLIGKKKAEMLGPPSEWGFLRDPCYAYVLLGACAMTLGCTIPSDCLNLLKKVYTEGGLMPGALGQMRKALYGPDGFSNGVAYDFESKDIIETANSKEDNNPMSIGGFRLLNVMGPGGLFNTGMGNSSTSAIIKELREQHFKSDLCGGCGIRTQASGDALVQCSKCKARKYCGRECQKKHWKVHKKVCDPISG